MKNSDILTNYNNLNDVMQRDLTLPIKISYCIARNFRALQAIAKDIEESRMKVLYEYGEPIVDQPNLYKAKDGKEDIMLKEIDALLDIDTNVTIQTISIEDLDGVQLSLQDMDKLYFMISEG